MGFLFSPAIDIRLTDRNDFSKIIGLNKLLPATTDKIKINICTKPANNYFETETATIKTPSKWTHTFASATSPHGRLPLQRAGKVMLGVVIGEGAGTLGRHVVRQGWPGTAVLDGVTGWDWQIQGGCRVLVISVPQVVVVGPLADAGDLGIGRSRRVQLSERRQADQSRGVVLRSFSEPAHRDLNGSRRMYKMATWRLATRVIDDSGRRWWVVSSAVGPAVRATTTATTRDGSTVLKSNPKGYSQSTKRSRKFFK